MSTITIHGMGVGRGVAIGRAVVIDFGRADVVHYFIDPSQVEDEIARVHAARDAAVQEMQLVLATLPKDAPNELPALLDVHLMLLQDDELFNGVRYWIANRLYNAGWALSNQFERLARQFDEMQDPYLRERKADLEQVIERIIKRLQGKPLPLPMAQTPAANAAPDAPAEDPEDALVLVAHDLSPSDMLHFRQSVFKGFITDVGGTTSHTAIVARSIGIPAIVGARGASHLIRNDDLIVIDGDNGVIIINPPAITLDEYSFRQRQHALDRSRLLRLLPRSMGTKSSCLPTSKCPKTPPPHWQRVQRAWGYFAASFYSWGGKTACPTKKSSTRPTSKPCKACTACHLPSAP